MLVKHLLRIDSRPADLDALSRSLGDEIEMRLRRESPHMTATYRDISAGLPLLDQDWINASMTAPEQRDRQDDEHLALSDRLIAEIDAADVVLITAPMHNFSVPGVLKAWIDLVCRPGLSFEYGPEGVAGLLADRPVYLALSTGGVPMGSPADFMGAYLQHIFGFIGIHDVRQVAAERADIDPEGSVAGAYQALSQWLPLEQEAIA